MALVRWEPFREIESMQRQMNRLFDQMMSPTFGERTGEEMTFVPDAEIHETDNEVKLRMEVPGIESKDLDVKVTAEAVAIAGERKSETKAEERGMRRSEFRYGRFQRVIPLPTRIQNDKVQAEFKNGVLCLTMPKAEEEKNRVVTINLAGQNQQQQIPAEQGQQGQPQAQQTQNNQQTSAGVS
jgi:HSP20 family protein